MTKENNDYSNDTKHYTDAEFALYCESVEKQYQQAAEQGVFKILEILDLDEEHSDKHLVQAVHYFKQNNGKIEKDAPDGFLTEREIKIINQDGNFRSGLYCMLLSQKFAEGMQNKSLFLKHSLKYNFER